MSKRGIEVGGIHIGSSSDNHSVNSRSDNDPFKILIMGNFSGNPSVAALKPVQVDRDNFEDVLANLAPKISIRLTKDGPEDTVLSFKSLEDFEPDHIYETLGIFSDLRQLRRKLLNQATFAEAAEQMLGATAVPGVYTKKDPAPDNASVPDATDLLGSLIDATEERKYNPPAQSSDIARSIIQDVIRPYVLPTEDPRKDDLVASVDKSTSELMNFILHQAAFQAMEAAWRSLYFLVRRISTDSQLKLFILDLNKQQLAKSVDNDNVTETTFYRSIVESSHFTPGGKPWAVWLGNYAINDEGEDIFLLERMGSLASLAGISFVAAASPHLIDCENFSRAPYYEQWQLQRNPKLVQAWEILRNTEQAKHIGLIIPRFLMRMPYGKKYKPIEAFDFDETPEKHHEHYLWANGIFAVALVLAHSFEAGGWHFKLGQVNEVTDLPSYVFDDDGEQVLMPCAEILMPEIAAEKIMSKGVMPLWTIKNEPRIRVGPLVSLHVSNNLILGGWK